MQVNDRNSEELDEIIRTELSVKNSLEVDSLMHIMLAEERRLGTEI